MELGLCRAPGMKHAKPHAQTGTCIDWLKQIKQLPASTATQVGAAYQGPHDPDEHIAWLEQRIASLERDLAGAEERHKQLDHIYTKLADQWNAFQATAKPDNRNVHRAEAAGELARKLAEAFLCLAYDKDARQALLAVLGELAMAQADSQHANLARGFLPLPEKR